MNMIADSESASTIYLEKRLGGTCRIPWRIPLGMPRVDTLGCPGRLIAAEQILFRPPNQPKSTPRNIRPAKPTKNDALVPEGRGRVSRGFT